MHVKCNMLLTDLSCNMHYHIMRRNKSLQTVNAITNESKIEKLSLSFFLQLSGCYCYMELQCYCELYRTIVALPGISMECRMAALTRYIMWY